MRLSLIAFLSCFVLGSISAQSEDGLFKAIGMSQLDQLETRLADEVEFCILDNQKRLKKAEVVTRLREFLKKNQVLSSRQVHYGDSKENGSYYRVGKLKTQKGIYRVFLYIENAKIVELRIDSY